MQKNIYKLLFITIILCNFNLVGQDENTQPSPTQDDILHDIPHYLRQKRQEDNDFIQGFVKELQGERGAIKKVEDEMIRTVDNNIYNKKLELNGMPATMEFFIWFYGLLFENRSKMVIDIKNLHDWQQKKYKEIKDLSQQYARRDVIKGEAVIKRTCKKLKLKYKSKNGKLHRIGEQGENGLKLLPNPDIDCLKKQKDLIQIMIIKALKGFHNEKIPVTEEEVKAILKTRLLFEKYSAKLDTVLKNHNKLVEEYENNKKEKEVINENNEN